MSALEKFLMKAAGKAGAGVGYAKGMGQWAAKEHPMATGAALGAGGAMAMGGDDDGDEHDEEGKLKELLHKLGL